MVSSRADPSEPLSIPSPSPPVPRPSFPFSTFVFSVIAVLLLASQAGLCVADSSSDDGLGTVTWIFPKGGEVFHHLDTVNVSYQSSYSEPWLYIWCYINQTANTVRFIRKREVDPYDASVLIYMDFLTSTPCWFNLRDNTNSNKGRNTENWSLKQTERQSGPITTGAPVPSTTASTSRPTSSTSGAAAAAAESATAAAGASSNDGISAGGKAGLGIGVGIATSLLCAGAFWLYYRHVKRKEHHQEVYRRIVGGREGGAAGAGPGPSGPGQDAFSSTPNNNNNEHLEPWRYGGTPQPAPSAVGSAWSGVSDPSTTTEWYPGGQTTTTTTANAPYQYYDPVGGSSSHQLGAMAGAGPASSSYYHHHHHPPPPPSVLTTTASMAAEPPPSVVARHHDHSTDHVPEAAAIRNVQDLSSSLYPSEYSEPVSPVSAAADRSIPPPTRVGSVNYGPNGPRDASTGADFTLLPGYTGGEEQEEEDIYGPPTPRSSSSPPPAPLYSAHAQMASGHLTTQQQETVAQEELAAWRQRQQHGGSHSAGANNNVFELPTAQTHTRGYGPRAELPAADEDGGSGVRVQLQLQQRSDLRGPEQKVLLREAPATMRAGQQRNDGG